MLTGAQRPVDAEVPAGAEGLTDAKEPADAEDPASAEGPADVEEAVMICYKHQY